MGMYKIRRVYPNGWGDFRPRGKSTKYITSTERLKLGGVYMLRGNEYYRVEKIF